MKLIFAQGNPGKQHQATRHNVGFLVADELAHQNASQFKTINKFFADIAETSIHGEKIIVAKPTTFYNETGKSLNAIRQFYKLDNSDILIIHDELALPFGTLRTRIGGSDGGNNGVKSVNTHGGSNTIRLRIGVGNDQRSLIGDVDFVLGKFSKDEYTALEKAIIPKSLEIIQEFITGNHIATSYKLSN